MKNAQHSTTWTINGKIVSPLQKKSLFFPQLFSSLSIFLFPLLSFYSPLCFHLQSNSSLPESLRNSDKRRNGPDFQNDSKKRKVEDKDSSHYVRFLFSDCMFICAKGCKKNNIYLCWFANNFLVIAHIITHQMLVYVSVGIFSTWIFNC